MSPEEIMRELRATLPELSDDDRKVARTVVRTLAGGEPLTIGRVAGILGRPEPAAEEAIGRVHWVQRDDAGRIVGCNGLSLTETAHRLRFDGRELFAWCAMDALFLPLVLGETVWIESTCPASGERITLTVTAEGDLRDTSPAGTVISYLLPDEDKPVTREINRVIGVFCNNINFFADAAVAGPWIARHDGTFLLPLDDAFTIAARFHAPRLFGVTGRPAWT